MTEYRVNMGQLISRLKTDLNLFEKHPEHSEMLKRRINKHKSAIVSCVVSHAEDPYYANLFKELVYTGDDYDKDCEDNG